MAEKAVIKLSSEVKELQNLSKKDLANFEKANKLVALYAKKKAEKEKAEAEMKALKTSIEDAVPDVVERKELFVVYGVQEGKKAVRGYQAKPKFEWDEDTVLVGLYKHYGEDINNKKGKAWEAWKSITKVNPQPRIFDESAFKQALKGANKLVPQEFLNGDVRVEVPAKFNLSIKPMDEDEMFDYQSNKIPSAFVTKPGV